ncbi:MAG: vacuolar-type H+-ATPase subunit F/Vma7, partial [Aureispira sp.]
MSFLDEIAKLQQDISKYLTIHNNPDDTSKHEPFAKKLVVTIPTLEKAAPSPSKKTITNAVGKGA